MTITFSIILILFVFILVYLPVLKKRTEQVRVGSIPKKSFNYSGQEFGVMLDITYLTNEDRLLQIASQVDNYFSETKIFLDAKLSCTLVGNNLKINPRLIANAIRFKYGISLRDYINERRIRYIEEVLVPSNDIKKYSLDYIAEMAGFGTRQGFYIALKKLKKCTPKEYFGELV